MGNLYRLLKGKVEGSSLDGKSSRAKRSKGGAKGGAGARNAGGKQGMADALAEMTKRYICLSQNMIKPRKLPCLSKKKSFKIGILIKFSYLTVH